MGIDNLPEDLTIGQKITLFIKDRIPDCVQSAEWNLGKGFTTEAYGWECRLVELHALAEDFRLGDLMGEIDRERIKLRDAREAYEPFA